MPSWVDYESTLESKIDAFYGESVRLIPKKITEGYSSGASDDGSRSPVDAVAYALTRGAMSKSGGAFISKRTEADYIIRVDVKYLTETREKDYVQFLDVRRNNLLCEITFIEPALTVRRTLHLMEVKG